MSAEVLRRAAVLMRERAREATPSPWVWEQIEGRYSSKEGLVRTQHPHYEDQANEVAETLDGHDAVFIAGMSPAVALAVADWLDGLADGWADDPGCDLGGGYDFSPPCESCFRCAYYETQMRALAVANAYLGTADV